MPKKTKKPTGKTATDPTLNLWRDHEPLQPSEIRPGALFSHTKRKAVVVAKSVQDDAILDVLTDNDAMQRYMSTITTAAPAKGGA